MEQFEYQDDYQTIIYEAKKKPSLASLLLARQRLEIEIKMFNEKVKKEIGQHPK